MNQTCDCRVLWVDDSPRELRYIDLNGLNRINIDYASNLDVAIHKLSTNDYQLIITDMIMNGSDTYTLSGYSHKFDLSDICQGEILIELIRNGEIGKDIGKSYIQSIPIIIYTVMLDLNLLKSYNNIYIRTKRDVFNSNSQQYFIDTINTLCKNDNTT